MQTPAIIAPTPVSFEANLRALAKLNRDLAASLAEVEPYSPEEIEFVETDEGAPSARLQGRWLASRRRPLAEVPGLVEKANIREKPIVVILGFGLGHHVKAIGAEMGAKGAILVFEPDLRLIRTVLERIDCRWLAGANVIFFTDPEDGPTVSRLLHGQDAFVTQGVQFVEHAPSMPRLGESARKFSETFTQYVAATKLNVQTTLVQMQATARNILANLKYYAGGAGIKDLRGSCKGYPAIVVSAGPSLAKNVDLLARPGVRERCAIIAVQTVLKPLLRLGVRPHFITALDYHEISKRFYEGLSEEDVRGVQLVAEAKSNPAILDSFPGPIRNCADLLAHRLLDGALDCDMGSIPAGATVAHLAFYLAQYLGCDPIIFIGQDLGFTDGHYYGGRNPIHDVWGPELNPFRTLEMLEWERIRRMRPMKKEDQQGRPIFVDEQMHTYQDQFERDFADAPQRIIDATEGGTRKRHTEIMTLSAALDEYLKDELPQIPQAATELEQSRLQVAAEQVQRVRREVLELGKLSRETASLIRKMLRDLEDRPRFEQSYRKLEKKRAEVGKLGRAFGVVEVINQTAAFKRLKADRALAMERDLPALERQRRQLERDLPNVEWIAEASKTMADLLRISEDRLRGVELPPESYTRPPAALADTNRVLTKATVKERVTAIVPIRSDQLNHLATQPRREQGDSRSLLQHTLARVGKCKHLTSLTVLTPDREGALPLIDSASLRVPVEVVETQGDPLGPKQEAILTARAFAPTCWRGALGGTTCYDEIIAAGAAKTFLEDADLSAALFVGPDWALVDPGLCDRLIEQYWVAPDRFAIVFTQSPPGLCGVLLSLPVLEQLAEPMPLSTLGCMMGYLPAKPQGDPIARDHCLPIEQKVRQSLQSAVMGSESRVRDFADLLGSEAEAAAVIECAESRAADLAASALPQHLIVELCTDRLTDGPAAVPRRCPDGEIIERSPMSEDFFRKLLGQLPEESLPALTFAGVGDPLLHPSCAHFVRLAKERGARVHVRTDLLIERSVAKDLLEAGVDVVSVNLSAQRAVTYQAAMGQTRYREVLENVEFLRASQRIAGGLSMPWVVPRLVRCDATYDEIEGFYDKWLMLFQAALIEPMPAWSPYAGEQRLRPVPMPDAVLRAERMRTLYIRCDGGVVNEEIDLYRERTLGNISDAALTDLWRRSCELTQKDFQTNEARRDG